MSILKKAAEILVESGYAVKRYTDLHSEYLGYVCVVDDDWPSATGHRPEKVEIFADTLEGRRQADAIEDWLWYNQNRIYANSYHAVDEPLDEGVSHHQWRLDRIKWCLEQLSDDTNGESDE